MEPVNVGLWGMVAFGLGYELQGIIENKRAGRVVIELITPALHRLANQPYWALALWGFSGIAAYHFLIQPIIDRINDVPVESVVS